MTSFMQPAPVPNQVDMDSDADDAVADPLSDATMTLLYDTARRNREVFTELFRPVPTNLVRNWDAYEVRVCQRVAARTSAHRACCRITCQGCARGTSFPVSRWSASRTAFRSYAVRSSRRLWYFIFSFLRRADADGRLL